MSKKEEYYGIYFNDDIPKTDKVNKFSKEVEVKFEGKAFLIERDDDGEIQKREELYTEDKLRKEKDYEIEFTNENGETYTLQVRIETSYLFFILLLFLLGFLIGLILTRPLGDGNSIFDRFYNFISLSVIDLSIDANNENKTEENRKPEKKYEFNVTFKNIDSDDINLTNSISGKALAKNKIAPRSKWKFFNSIKYQKKYSRYEIQS